MFVDGVYIYASTITMRERNMQPVQKKIQYGQAKECYMLQANPVYQTKKIKLFLADLIHDCDFQKYSDLTNFEKRKFTALLLEASAQEGFDYEFLTESHGVTEMLAFVRKALASEGWLDEALGDVIINQAISYHEETMQLLFNEAVADYKASSNEWMDYACKYGDPDDAYEKYKSNLTTL